MTDSDTPPSFPYRTTHNWETDDPITLTIVEAVEDLNGDDESLPQLYDHINPDALEALLEPSLGGDPRPSVSVSFEYDDYEIFVAGSGDVVIDAAE
jgi:hypothetical protein